jgi:hypothetical protein
LTKPEAAAYAREWRKRNKEHLQKHKRKYYYMKRYGISEDTVNQLKQKQGVGCKLCGATEFLHLDHYHTTGKIRGFICNYCNMCLGWVERVKMNIIQEYLENTDLGINVNMKNWENTQKGKSTFALAMLIDPNGEGIGV